MKLINHVKIWNIWRKRSLDSWLYKFLVLIGFVKSPSLEFIKVVYAEIKEYKKECLEVLDETVNTLSCMINEDEVKQE